MLAATAVLAPGGGGRARTRSRRRGRAATRRQQLQPQDEALVVCARGLDRRHHPVARRSASLRTPRRRAVRAPARRPPGRNSRPRPRATRPSPPSARGRRPSRGGRRPPLGVGCRRARRGGPAWRRRGPSRVPRARCSCVRSSWSVTTMVRRPSATMAASTASAKRTVARDARFTRSRLPHGHCSDAPTMPAVSSSVAARLRDGVGVPAQLEAVRRGRCTRCREVGRGRVERGQRAHVWSWANSRLPTFISPSSTRFPPLTRSARSPR